MKKAILFIVLAALCSFVKVTAQNTNSQSAQVTGKVTDEQGQPLPGATIKLKEKPALIVSTDQNGLFKINQVPPTGTLVISFVSYQTTEVKYNNSTTNPINIQLKGDVNSLNEVQVIGYGTTTKRLNTGNVSTITSAQIDNQPVSNPIAALQGRASGVSIQTANGLPGGNISIQIRGQGSIASGTTPLYVIDGVPFLSSPISSSQSGNGQISPLSIINPGDIASIDILKDADATAIYGSRGANGVVLITTKKGVAGKTDFTVIANHGFSEISRYNQYLTLPQYLQMRNEAFKNDGITPTVSNAPDLLVWSQTQTTDWQKYEFRNRAAITNIQTSLTGGNADTKFLFSTNYRNEGSILPGDENYKKGGGYLNLIHTSSDKKFTASFTANYELDDNHTLFNASTTIASLPPNYPIYNADGSYNFQANYNPVAYLNQRTRIQSNNIIANGILQYNLFKGLVLKTNLGYTKYNIDQLATLPQASQSNLFVTPVATAYQTTNSSESYIIEPQIDYTLKKGDGILSVLVGGTLQDRVDKGNTLTQTGVNNPDLLGNLGAASTITGANTYSEYKYVSLFGRVNYNWQQKYLIDLNFRRDGSSRFGNDKQFGNFGAAGAAWLFSQEDFIKENIPFLSYGKLRGSYGVSGNDQIADYQYLTAYSSSTVYGGTASLAPSRIANPNYSWETTHQTEAALELGFLKDRILITAARYRRKSDNQLVIYPLPYQSGFSGYQANLPAIVQNTGWEFDLNTVNIKTERMSWTSSFNLTIPKNVLVAYPGIAGSSYANTLVVGQDLSVAKGYHFLGINSQTGLPRFEDVNNDGLVRFPEDVVVLGNTSPIVYGGFSNTVSYKSIQLDIFLEYRKQNSFGYKPAYGSIIENEPAYVLGRWQQTDDQTDIPRFTTLSSNLTNLNASNATFGDASYIRVKNIALSYKLEPSLLKKLNVKALSLFLQAQNILTFDNKKRFDPEISGSLGSVPPLRTILAGIKITL